MKTTVALADWDANIEETAKKLGESPYNRVVLCVEDRHVLYREDNVKEAVDLIKAEGLEVHLDPWGIQGFSGESISHPMAFYSWLRLAEVTNADGIMLDEPTSHCNLSMDKIIDATNTYTPDMPLHLAVKPEHLTKAVHDQVSEVSLSAYFFGRQVSMATEQSVYWQVQDWYEQFRDCMDSVWIQLWGLPAGKEWMPAFLIELWTDLDVPVNIWAWNSFRTVSSKRPDNPDLVWNSTMEALEVHLKK